MATEYLIPSSEEEWLSWRKQDITSTEASALFNLSPYATKFELFFSKQSGDGSAFEDNERMEAGRHIEPAIASLVSARYDVALTTMKMYARDAEDRIGSSFDYRCEDGAAFGFPGEPGIVECKNVDGLIFKRKWLDDETPAHIEIQLQHQLEVTGLAWGAIMALVGGNRLVPYVRARDEAVGRSIRSAVRAFWRSIDANDPPPPAYPDDADAVIAVSQFSDGSVFDARKNPLLDEMTFLLAGIKEQIASLETKQKVVKAQILQQVGDAGTLLYSGGKVVMTQTKDTPAKIITPEMIGQEIGGRKGYRMFRIYEKKEKSE